MTILGKVSLALVLSGLTIILLSVIMVIISHFASLPFLRPLVVCIVSGGLLFVFGLCLGALEVPLDSIDREKSK